ncbi:MAG: translation elongation factor Ts, partial [Bdellovibrio sp.]
MSISASMVRDLRERTNAGMLDCKKALEETAGNFDAAVEWLRKKGLASAAKKADRLASEGMIVSSVLEGHKAVLVEVNSETDFVAKNDLFKKFVKDVADVVVRANPPLADVDTLLNQTLPGSVGGKAATGG